MDADQKKKLLRMVPYGLYLMGVRRAKVANVASDINAFIASWVTQTSFDPPMLVACVKRDGHSIEMLRESKVFTLNILKSDQKELATTFFKTLDVTETTMSGVAYERGSKTGCPTFPELAGHVECEVKHIYEGDNDHAVVVAEIVDAIQRDTEAKAMTHADTGWHYAG